MKKLTAILILALTLVNLVAFEAVTPATEMSGKYLRFVSMNEKSFMDIDDGFNRIALSIAKPNLYRNWSLSTDASLFGDDIYNEVHWNLSPAYTFKKNYTLAVSVGLINKSLDTGKLIFGESEAIDEDSVIEPNIGASFHGNFLNEKLELGVSSSYLNQPVVNFMDSSDKNSPMFKANLDWKINKQYKVGLFYKNEDKLNYAGLNFEVKFPYPNLNHKVSASADRVSYNPMFSLINYWQVGLAYDLYLDSELGYQNMELDLIYEYTGKQKPVINVEEINADDAATNVNFYVSGADRFYNITATVNDDKLLEVNNIWDHDQKSFSIPLQLLDGENVIEISATSVSNEKTVTTINVIYQVEPEVKKVVKKPRKKAKIEEMVQTETKVETEIVQGPQKEVIADVVLINLPKGYRSTGDQPYIYEVKKGDNLWNIAKLNYILGDPFKWVQIHNKNGLIIKNPDLIYPEQIIYIENNSRYDEVIKYKVEKGDNLWNIAYGTSKTEDDRKLLIMTNNETLPDPSFIEPGQVIIIKTFYVK